METKEETRKEIYRLEAKIRDGYIYWQELEEGNRFTTADTLLGKLKNMENRLKELKATL